MEKERPVILHFHIFKNAGTTIEWILKKNFHDGLKILDDPYTDSAINMSLLPYYLYHHKNVKAISSHQFRFPLPCVDSFHFIPCVFIRHPLDRIFSVYNHFKRSVDSYILSIKARELNFKDFVYWYMTSDIYDIMYNGTIKNAHVLTFSFQKYLTNLSNNDLYLSFDRLRKTEIIGLIELMDESLVLAEDVLKKYFDNVDLSYISQNSTPNKIDDFDDRIEFIRTTLGNDLVKIVSDNNKFDLLFYSEAYRELQNRINEISNFETKLTDFRTRCKKITVNNLKM